MATRTYLVSESVVFRKTKEEWGGLSNMAAGFSLNVNNIIILTAEHLYQALRFPDYPDIQLDIINERSPMKAKWIGRAHIKHTRPDWERLQFKIMLWALEVKLCQNWESFSKLLLATNNKNIVELTPKPKLWGAVKKGNQLEGINALGRLLMQLRESYVKTGIKLECVPPLEIQNFKFLGHNIQPIYSEYNRQIPSENLKIEFEYN